MKYIVFGKARNGHGDIFNKEFVDQDEAIKEAVHEWDCLTDSEKVERTIYVIESANPDKKAENHMNGNTVWKPEEEVVEEILDYIIHLVGESNNPKKIEDHIDLYINDAVENEYGCFPENYKNHLISEIELSYEAWNDSEEL